MILEADQIVVMNQGSVVDCGSHAELVERCATYERLYRLQFAVGDGPVSGNGRSYRTGQAGDAVGSRVIWVTEKRRVGPENHRRRVPRQPELICQPV